MFTSETRIIIIILSTFRNRGLIRDPRFTCVLIYLSFPLPLACLPSLLLHDPRNFASMWLLHALPSSHFISVPNLWTRNSMTPTQVLRDPDDRKGLMIVDAERETPSKNFILLLKLKRYQDQLDLITRHGRYAGPSRNIAFAPFVDGTEGMARLHLVLESAKQSFYR